MTRQMLLGKLVFVQLGHGPAQGEQQAEVTAKLAGSKQIHLITRTACLIRRLSGDEARHCFRCSRSCSSLPLCFSCQPLGVR